jgi:hypothetical protein
VNPLVQRAFIDVKLSAAPPQKAGASFQTSHVVVVLVARCDSGVDCSQKRTGLNVQAIHELPQRIRIEGNSLETNGKFAASESPSV